MKNAVAKAALFDLDGTLIDSRRDVAQGHRHAILSVGGAPPEEETIYPLIGMSLEETYRLLLPENLHNKIGEAATAYKAYYYDHCTRHSLPYPGVVEGLKVLRRHGFVLAVATTKRSYQAQHVLDLMKMAAQFDHVQGTDDFQHKPSPEVVLRCLSALKINGLKSSSWMIGDTARDIQAGATAGLLTAAAFWGYGNHDELFAQSPNIAAATFDELVERLVQWNA
jgi:phosphoglycolate phosphatase